MVDKGERGRKWKRGVERCKPRGKRISSEEEEGESKRDEDSEKSRWRNEMERRAWRGTNKKKNGDQIAKRH